MQNEGRIHSSFLICCGKKGFTSTVKKLEISLDLTGCYGQKTLADTLDVSFQK